MPQVNPLQRSYASRWILKFEIMRADHLTTARAKRKLLAAALAKRMLQAKQRGESEITVGNLKTIRDFTDVRDVVRAYS